MFVTINSLHQLSLMARYNVLQLISFTTFFVVLVRAQDQSGFVSIDCGIPDDSSYNDEKTDIKYVSDAAYVESGTIHSIDSEFQTSSLEKQFQNVRAFPEGKRNCYDVQPPRGKGFKYLIRTRFMYGNYDSLGKAPDFDLYLGVNLWDSVAIDNATTVVTKEIIHTLRSGRVHVCLVNKDKGTPFLSVLELRLLKSDTYITPYDSLMLTRRWDLGGLGDRPVRYKDDVFDRIWMPLRFPKYTIFNASETIDPNNNNGFQPARFVMNTATSPEDLSQDIIIYWEPTDPTWKNYLYMHFAEVVELPSNETREFTVLLNEKPINMSLFSPRYLYTDTLVHENPVSGPKLEFRLASTVRSTLPPIINAVETYRVNDFLHSPTDEQDVNAIMLIKSKYGVKKNWLGDPCSPINYPWKDINCTYADNEPPRIVSVNISFSGLTGQIDPAFSNLTSDLSYNSLTGKIPDSLGNLLNLIELNLEGNKLTGSIPVKLMERSNSGSLKLRYGGNPNLCVSASCQIPDSKKKKNVYIIPLVASVAGVLGLVIVIVLFLLYKKRHQRGVANSVGNGPLDTTKRYYKYSEVVKITNNFERVLGQGGFGKVYYGVINKVQVAVKILSESSTQGYREFRAEVELLLRVHHKNLTALIGYCHEEEKKMALIYEFMANGTLGDYLSGKNSYVLSWEERLQISLDAAQGLEYLHNGCKPPIVQRDVKPANILINDKLQGKIADFGLSRSVDLDGTSHQNTSMTAVAGTIGYLDPEYQSTQALSEKSDVYSFGVVLLEVVTGQPVIARSKTTMENIHVTDCVESFLSTGDIRSIVDPKLGERFDAGSAWKITEIAMACASRSSRNRPTMSEVVSELKESVRRARDCGGSGASSVTEPSMSGSDSRMFPQAR